VLALQGDVGIEAVGVDGGGGVAEQIDEEPPVAAAARQLERPLLELGGGRPVEFVCVHAFSLGRKAVSGVSMRFCALCAL
jgi:hypothetical protein